MASRFVLTAQVQLQAPTNARQVVNQIQQQLQGVNVQVNLQGGQQAAKQVNNITKATKQATTQAQKMGKAFGTSIRRFSAFSIASRGISLLTSGLANATNEAIDFEREMIKISQVTGKTMGQLKGLENTITDLATSFGVSSKSILSVGRILAQAGIQARDLDVALTALAKTELAPTFDDITKTAEGAVAILAQFGEGVGALERQLGAINRVAGQFAVESGDLISVVRRTGGVFKAAGGELEELIALFTSVRATTRESAESIATGLRTIFTRIQRPKTIEFLKQFGVELTDLNGKFIGPYEAVRQLSDALSGLGEGDIRFVKIAEELGGFRQIGKVIPLLQQFEVAERARQAALEGGTSLDEDATKAQKALAVQISKVKEEFQALIRSITQSSAFQVFVKTALELSSAFIRIADTLKPLLPLLATVAAFKFARGAAGFARGLGAGFKGAKGFNTGGMVPGTGNRDTVPAMLTPGEFVIRKSSVAKIGAGNLAAMNVKGYAEGGPVSDYKSSKPYASYNEQTFNKRKGGYFRLKPEADKKATRFNPEDEFSYTLKKENYNLEKYESQIKNNPEAQKAYREYVIAARNARDIERGNAFEAVLRELNLFKSPENVLKKDSSTRSSRLDGVIGSKLIEIKSNRKAADLDNLSDKMIGAALDPITNIDKIVADRFKNNATLNDAANKFKLGALTLIQDTTPTTLTKEAKRKLNTEESELVPGQEEPVSRIKKAKQKSRTARRNAGGGISGSDTVPAMLTPGEFVFSKKAAQSIGYSNLSRMNTQGVQGFNKGGPVGGVQYLNKAGKVEGSVLPNAFFNELKRVIAELKGVSADSGQRRDAARKIQRQGSTKLHPDTNAGKVDPDVLQKFNTEFNNLVDAIAKGRPGVSHYFTQLAELEKATRKAAQEKNKEAESQSKQQEATDNRTPAQARQEAAAKQQASAQEQEANARRDRTPAEARAEAAAKQQASAQPRQQFGRKSTQEIQAGIDFKKSQRDQLRESVNNAEARSKEDGMDRSKMVSAGRQKIQQMNEEIASDEQKLNSVRHARDKSVNAGPPPEAQYNSAAAFGGGQRARAESAFSGTSDQIKGAGGAAFGGRQRAEAQSAFSGTSDQMKGAGSAAFGAGARQANENVEKTGTGLADTTNYTQSIASLTKQIAKYEAEIMKGWQAADTINDNLIDLSDAVEKEQIALGQGTGSKEALAKAQADLASYIVTSTAQREALDQREEALVDLREKAEQKRAKAMVLAKNAKADAKRNMRSGNSSFKESSQSATAFVKAQAQARNTSGSAGMFAFGAGKKIDNEAAAKEAKNKSIRDSFLGGKKQDQKTEEPASKSGDIVAAIKECCDKTINLLSSSLGGIDVLTTHAVERNNLLSSMLGGIDALTDHASTVQPPPVAPPAPPVGDSTENSNTDDNTDDKKEEQGNKSEKRTASENKLQSLLLTAGAIGSLLPQVEGATEGFKAVQNSIPKATAQFAALTATGAALGSELSESKLLGKAGPVLGEMANSAGKVAGAMAAVNTVIDAYNGTHLKAEEAIKAASEANDEASLAAAEKAAVDSSSQQALNKASVAVSGGFAAVGGALSKIPGPIGAFLGTVTPLIGAIAGVAVKMGALESLFGISAEGLQDFMGSLGLGDTTDQVKAQTKYTIQSARAQRELAEAAKDATEELKEIEAGNLTASGSLGAGGAAARAAKAVDAQVQAAKDLVKANQDQTAQIQNSPIGSFIDNFTGRTASLESANKSLEKEQIKAGQDFIESQRSRFALATKEQVVASAAAGGSTSFDDFLGSLDPSIRAVIENTDKMNGNSDEMDKLRKNFENQKKAVMDNIKFVKAMNFGLSEVTSGIKAYSSSLNNLVAAQETGFSTAGYAAETLASAISSAGKFVSSSQLGQSLNALEDNLKRFGANAEQITDAKALITGLNDLQKNASDALLAVKSGFKGGATSPEAIKNQIRDAIVGSIPDSSPIKQKLIDSFGKLELPPEAVQEFLNTGDVSVILDKAFGPIQEQVQKQLIGPLQQMAEQEKILVGLTQQRREAEKKLIAVQQQAIDTQIDAAKAFEEFGGAKFTPEREFDARRQQANLVLRDAGIQGLAGGSANDIRAARDQIFSNFSRQQQLQNAAAAGGGGAFGGAAGIDADRREELKAANEALINFTKQGIEARKQELELIKKKNAAEKQALDSLLTGDIESFFDQAIGAAAGSALRTGNAQVASLFGAGALGKGLQGIQDTGLSDAENKRAASIAFGAFGLGGDAASLYTGTTREEEQIKAQGRELALMQGDLASQSAEMEEMSVQAREVVISAANVRLNEIGQQVSSAQAALNFNSRGGVIYANRGMFVPRGTDTVPAMLTPGEFVVNRAAVNRGNNLQILRAMNSNSAPIQAAQGFSGGGAVRYRAGGSTGPEPAGGGMDFSKFEELVNKFQEVTDKLGNVNIKHMFDKLGTLDINHMFNGNMQQALKDEILTEAGNMMARSKFNNDGSITTSDRSVLG